MAHILNFIKIDATKNVDLNRFKKIVKNLFIGHRMLRGMFPFHLLCHDFTPFHPHYELGVVVLQTITYRYVWVLMAKTLKHSETYNG